MEPMEVVKDSHQEEEKKAVVLSPKSKKRQISKCSNSISNNFK
jgi:hypothetical protein